MTAHMSGEWGSATTAVLCRGPPCHVANQGVTPCRRITTLGDPDSMPRFVSAFASSGLCLRRHHGACQATLKLSPP